MSAADDLLKALLAETPPPPRPTVDPEDVLTLGEEMVGARGKLLEAAGPEHRDGADPKLLEELKERDQRWAAAILRAKHQLGERARGVGRLGGYPK